MKHADVQPGAPQPGEFLIYETSVVNHWLTTAAELIAECTDSRHTKQHRERKP